MSTTLTESDTSGQSATTQTTDNSAPATQTTQTAKSWHESLPEDLRGDATLGRFKDVSDLAKAYKSAQGLIGKKGVVVPGEKASPEEWQRFYKDIGQPEKDKFGIAAPEGKQVDANILAKFKDWAHEEGLLPKQAQGIFNKFLASEEESAKAKAAQTAQATQEGIEGLKKEWGEGFSKQVALAKLGVKEVGGDEFSAYLDSSGLGNDVRLIKVMAKVGQMLGEDKIRGENTGGFGKTPAEINDEISAIMGNPKHPYFDNTHPGHKSATALMESLFKAQTRR